MLVTCPCGCGGPVRAGRRYASEQCRVRACRGRAHRGLVDDVLALWPEAPDSARFRALSALGDAALGILRDGLAGAPEGRCFTDRETGGAA